MRHRGGRGVSLQRMKNGLDPSGEFRRHEAGVATAMMPVTDAWFAAGEYEQRGYLRRGVWAAMNTGKERV